MFRRVERVLLSQVTLCRLEARLEAYTHTASSALQTVKPTYSIDGNSENNILYK